VCPIGPVFNIAAGLDRSHYYFSSVHSHSHFQRQSRLYDAQVVLAQFC
jgi:hypothetical protein